jgi:hypothetical protein
MSKRFFIFLFILAALITAVTYAYTTETTETLTEEGLADLVRVAKVHGWPWGYYAEVIEWSRMGENQIAMIEYNEPRGVMLVQTYLAWFVVLLLLSLFVAILMDYNQRGA